MERLRTEVFAAWKAMNKFIDEHKLHLAFEIGLVLKAIFALLEVAGGILAYFITQQFLLKVVLALTSHELAEDPNDFVATFLLQSARDFSVSSQHFTAFYLLGHGAIKLVLIAGLMRGILGIYPVAIAVFAGFIGYQLYRFTNTHSIWLLILTLLDMVVIWLTWHEYRYMQRRRALT
jgi:uncharacterized membrane protein